MQPSAAKLCNLGVHWQHWQQSRPSIRTQQEGGKVVPENGVEPSRSCDHWILSPARLPVPPLGHGGQNNTWHVVLQTVSFESRSNNGGRTSSVRCRLNCSIVPKCFRHVGHPVSTILCCAFMNVSRLWRSISSRSARRSSDFFTISQWRALSTLGNAQPCSFPKNAQFLRGLLGYRWHFWPTPYVGSELRLP
jgi:hypothetical protein